MTVFAKQRPPRNLPVAVAVESAYLSNMSVSLSRIVGLAVAVLLLGADATASARPKRHPAAQRPPAQVTTNCDGTPIIMQGMPCRQRPRARSGAGNGADRGAGTQARRAPPAHHARQRRSLRPLGSTHAIAVGCQQPSGSVYTPPAIANPSERIKDLNSSFPLNGGLGLNPSNRDDYIRYNLNR